MRNKPTNLRDFLMTVAQVQHPGLDAKHRLLLHNLALFANPAGCGAYPGSDHLEKVMGRSWKRINAYAKQLEEFGLLVRTQVGRKGRNTEWNFCLDSSAYPDIGGQEGDDLTTDIGGQNSPSLGGQNSPSLGGQNSPSLGGQIGDSPTNPTTNTTTNPTTGSGRVLRRTPATIVEPRPSLTKDELREARNRVLEIFIREENQTPAVSPDHVKELDIRIRKHGEDKVGAALKLDLREPAYFTSKKTGEQTRFPLARFLKRFDLLLKQVDIEKARKVTPQGEALAYRIARIRHFIPYLPDSAEFLGTISFQSSEADLSLADQIIETTPLAKPEPRAEDF